MTSVPAGRGQRGAESTVPNLLQHGESPPGNSPGNFGSGSVARLFRMLDDLRTLTSLLRGRLAADSPTESIILADHPHGRLRRYGTAAQVAAARRAGRPPVLLVPPFAVAARCYDLAPGNSVVEFLLSQGRIPYLVDFGEITRADRDLGFEYFFGTVVPRAATELLDDYRETSDFDIVAWSLGGVISVLAAADRPDLPVRSITAVGTPLNYSKIQPYPLLQKILGPTDGRPVTFALDLLGGIPAAAVRLGYRATSWQRELRKPAYILRNLDDRAALSRMQIIDRFQDSMPGYPGRVSHEMFVNLALRGELASGRIGFGDRTVDITGLRMPILLFGSHRDAIVSWGAVHHGVDLFTEAEVTFHTVEASHLGLLTGPVAAEQTWPRIAGLLDRLDAGETGTTGLSESETPALQQGPEFAGVH